MVPALKILRNDKTHWGPVGVTRRPNGRWRARIIGPDGRERARHFVRRSDALRWEAEQRAGLNRGIWIDPSNPTTVTQYAREWAAARPHRPTTARRVASQIDTHIAGTRLGALRLAVVRPSEVQAWATERSHRLAPSTARQMLGLLRSILAAASLDRLVASNPVVGIKLPAAKRERIVPLTIAQVEALADTVPERRRAMVITQAGLGLRPRSRRSVPLPDVVGNALAAHMARFAPLDDGTIFSSLTGERWRHETFRWHFRAGVKAAGLPHGTSTHDLRHHYASVLVASGESVVAVAERLGRDSAALVLSTYGHCMPDSEDRTRRAIDQAWHPDNLRTPRQESGS